VVIRCLLLLCSLAEGGKEGEGERRRERTEVKGGWGGEVHWILQIFGKGERMVEAFYEKGVVGKEDWLYLWLIRGGREGITSMRRRKRCTNQLLLMNTSRSTLRGRGKRG